MYEKDFISLKDFRVDYSKETFEVIESLLSLSFIKYSKLYDVYLDDKGRVKAFTISLNDVVKSFFVCYVSVSIKSGKIKDIVEIAYQRGDGGFIWENEISWLDKNTLLRSKKIFYHDITISQGSSKIHLQENGKIHFSDIKTIIHLGKEEVNLITQEKKKEIFDKELL